jgi:hypothetical protein
METANNLTQFTGTWRLLPELCKYDSGEIPQSATHTFQLAEAANTLHFVVDWKEANGKEHHHEYDVLVDGHAHELNQNGYIMQMTATATGNKLKLLYTRDDCTVEFECDSTTGEMPLLQRSLIEGKWINLHQTYRK